MFFPSVLVSINLSRRDDLTDPNAVLEKMPLLDSLGK